MKRAQHHPGGRGGVRFGGGGGGAGGVSPSKMLWATLPWPEYTYQYVWQTLLSQTTGYTRILPVCTGGSPGHQRHGPEGCPADILANFPAVPDRQGSLGVPAVRPTPAIATLSDISAPAATRFSVLVSCRPPNRPIAVAPASCGIAVCQHRAADSWRILGRPNGDQPEDLGARRVRSLAGPRVRSAAEGRGRRAFQDQRRGLAADIKINQKSEAGCRRLLSEGSARGTRPSNDANVTIWKRSVRRVRCSALALLKLSRSSIVAVVRHDFGTAMRSDWGRRIGS